MARRALAIVVLLLLAALLHPICAVRAELIYEFEFRASYTFENRGEKAYEIARGEKVFLYSANDTHQKLVIKEASHACLEIFIDDDNNTMAILDLPDLLEPGETLAVNICYAVQVWRYETPRLSVDLSGTLADIPIELREGYCDPVGPWNYTKWPEIKELALEIGKNESRVLGLLYEFVDWITRNIAYESSPYPRYPNETLAEGSGDCDDQANLLITFCRAVGIPAYLQIGCVYMPGKMHTSAWDDVVVSVAENVGFHAWAKVYVPPWGWLPVDLTFATKGRPSTAIEHSAIARHDVIAISLYNVIVSDYISHMKEYHSILKEEGLYVRAYYALNPAIPIQARFGPASLIVVGVACLAVIVSGLAFFYARAKKRNAVSA